MTIPTQYYVDPGATVDTGSGTVGSPWGPRSAGSKPAVQHALDTITQDTTNGDQINVKTGTADTLAAAITLSTYGTPNQAYPLIIRGYATAANDGGQGDIDGAGTYTIHAGNTSVHWIDMHLHNVGANRVLTLLNYSMALRCEISAGTGTANYGIYTGSYAQIHGCHIHDIQGYGVYCGAGGVICRDCYFKNDGTYDFTGAIRLFRMGHAINNIISIDGASKGIVGNNCYGSIIANNSILSAGGTGKGIEIPNASRIMAIVENNLVEGFSTGGGVGIEMTTGTINGGSMRGNAVYNCVTPYVGVTEDDYIMGIEADGAEADNETLGASPFAKSGAIPTDFTDADFWTDLFAYFAPVDTGNVHGGAYRGE